MDGHHVHLSAPEVSLKKLHAVEDATSSWRLSDQMNGDIKGILATPPQGIAGPNSRPY